MEVPILFLWAWRFFRPSVFPITLPTVVGDALNSFAFNRSMGATKTKTQTSQDSLESSQGCWPFSFTQTSGRNFLPDFVERSILKDLPRFRRLFVTSDVFTRYFFVAFSWFFRGFSVALICLEKQCLGIFRGFFVAFSWP